MNEKRREIELLILTMMAAAPLYATQTVPLVPLLHFSRTLSANDAGARPPEVPATRAAAFYVLGTTVMGIALFPLLPRVRNPLLPGIAASSNRASTGLSDTIDFNRPRNIEADPTVVSRVWMGQEAIPFFTPLRLRGVGYERFRD